MLNGLSSKTMHTKPIRCYIQDTINVFGESELPRIIQNKCQLYRDLILNIQNRESLLITEGSEN